MRILILGGTGEGFSLAERLHPVPGIDVISSMAGRTDAPKTPLGRVRRGGFGGPDGLSAYLKAERIAAMIDATHPFASGISKNAASAAAKTGTPVVHIRRPGWKKTAEDRWDEVATVRDAAAAIPAGTGLTFLTTGKMQLHRFAKRHDVPFLARTVGPISTRDKARGLPPQLSFVYDRGPFDLEAERRLLIDHDVKLMVTKNSGGDAAYAKLIAARELGIPVIMVRRPDAPDGICVADADEAMVWLTGLPNVGERLLEGSPV
ncbi:MAG: cobalt-precorrin-6A reductase [Hyphomicrobiaceae bacterium]